MRVRGNFEGMLNDTANGYGFWPDPDGYLCYAKGTTMKQMRAWAAWADSHEPDIEQP